MPFGPLAGEKRMAIAKKGPLFSITNQQTNMDQSPQFFQWMLRWLWLVTEDIALQLMSIFKRVISPVSAKM